MVWTSSTVIWELDTTTHILAYWVCVCVSKHVNKSACLSHISSQFSRAWISRFLPRRSHTFAPRVLFAILDGVFGASCVSARCSGWSILPGRLRTCALRVVCARGGLWVVRRTVEMVQCFGFSFIRKSAVFQLISCICSKSRYYAFI